MIDLKKVYQAVNRPSNTDSVYIILIIACLKMFMIWKTMSSNILSYRHDEKNLKKIKGLKYHFNIAQFIVTKKITNVFIVKTYF